MANTYTQIYIQVVFAVQGRQNLVCLERKEELQRYMTGIVTRQGQKLIAIHCMPDHTHLLIGLRPNIALSDLVGDIKTGSTNHINEHRWMPGRFSWQEGFGAFSYSHSQLKGVIDYIRDQVKHHARKTFRKSTWRSSSGMRFPTRHATPSGRWMRNSSVGKAAGLTQRPASNSPHSQLARESSVRSAMSITLGPNAPGQAP